MSQISSNMLSGSLRDRLEAMPTIPDAARLQGQRSFDKALGRAQSAASTPASKQEEARAAAEELVARALVQPIMAKMRESRDTAEPFGPSEVERAFGSISDAQFADRLTKSGNWSLVDVVAKKIMNAGKGNTAAAANAATATSASSTAAPATSQATQTDALAPLSIAAWAGVRKVTR